MDNFSGLLTNINLIITLPEIFITIMIIVMLMSDVFLNNKLFNYILIISTLIITLWLQLKIHTDQTQSAFNGMYLIDNLAFVTKIFTYIFALLTVIYSKQYITDKKIPQAEFYIIFLFAILGMMLMISANNLLILYLGLELLSLSLYGMIALYQSTIKATESAMKFFILGSLASGLLLYGISFAYGASGGLLQISQIANINFSGTNYNLMIFALVFIVAGLAFKLGLVPFHMWLPDVYEGSALAMTTIIGGVTKLAALVFIIRLLFGTMIFFSTAWVKMLLILALLSLLLGNLIAISQSNIKRMLAYSTIAQMGFVALGFMAKSSNGLAISLFYMISYIISALLTFAILLLLSKDDFECEQLEDLKGLNRSHPIYAAILMLSMLSMAGIPPLLGFYAKFSILEILINANLIKTAVFAVIMSLIGAFYYLRVIKLIYFDAPIKPLVAANSGAVSHIILFTNAILMLYISFSPNQLIKLSLSALA